MTRARTAAAREAEELVDVTAELVAETARAWRLDAGIGEQAPAWVPKSQVERNGRTEWTMPRWLAEERGLV